MRPNTLLFFLSVTALAACGSDKEDTESQDDGISDDTSDTGDTDDTGDTGDSGDTGDTGEAPLSCDTPVWLSGDFAPDAASVGDICAEGNAIEGDLLLSGSDLTDDLLAGLDCLCEVGGVLQVTDTGLTSMNGLSSLSSTGGLEVVGNARLETLDGLDALATVDGPVLLSQNPEMLRIEGLTSLQTTGAVSVVDLPLVNLRGLESLVTVGGDLVLDQLPALESMQGLSSLDFVDGNFSVTNTGSHDFSGLDSIRRVRAALVLMDSSASLAGLDALATVGGTVRLERVDRLRDLNGLTGLAEIGGHLRIEDAPTLNSLSGMTALRTISGSLWLERTNVGSLAPLQTTLAVGGLRLDTNPELVSTAGMPPVIGLSELVLHWNTSLGELTGLDSVRTIDGDLAINGHVQLDSVVELMEVEAVGGNFSVQNNTLLSDADGEALRDAIGSENIGGTITIGGNGG